MEPEFAALVPADNSVEVRYLDQALHMTPDKLTPLLQEQIDAAQNYASKVDKSISLLKEVMGR
jgi:hypothetical protein